MELTDLLLHIPNFLSEDECKTLSDEYDKRENDDWRYEACNHAKDGRYVQSTFRSVSLTDTECQAYKLFYSSTEKIIKKYHEYLHTFNAFHVAFEKALLYSHEYRLMKYSPGSWIHPHIDMGITDPFVFGSCSFNLSQDYTGGDFVFFRGKHRIKLGMGDAMIWPADFFWVHEVEEVTSGIRYSANSFLQSLPQDYKNSIIPTIDYKHSGGYII